jgi:hypothetical protein
VLYHTIPSMVTRHYDPRGDRDARNAVIQSIIKAVGAVRGLSGKVRFAFESKDLEVWLGMRLGAE